MSAAGHWVELAVSADREAVEAVSDILARVCPGGVALEAPYDLVDGGLAARVDPARAVTVRGYLPALDRAAVRHAVEQAERQLGHLQAFGLRPIGELSTRVIHEEDWAEAWKSHYPVMRIGRRLVIRPTWREHTAAPGEVVIALDPGMAFGTGLHPTTRLCLAALERLADDGQLARARVLDVGSGSGILAVAAGLLGASEVWTVDTDPLAVHATLANARRNGLAGVVQARQGSVRAAVGGFDVVLANLIASLLVELAVDLRAALRPAGWLVASGIFAEHQEEVRSAFGRAGLRVTDQTIETDWVALTAAGGRADSLG
ncbi:MAG: 50S ribosomal protein L11 methyltransferase [Chloroflexota bacterium]|nr:50S ribosomal protein L11 methyltransferase [Chloroflexota bacterium]